MNRFVKTAQAFLQDQVNFCGICICAVKQIDSHTNDVHPNGALARVLLDGQLTVYLFDCQNGNSAKLQCLWEIYVHLSNVFSYVGTWN